MISNSELAYYDQLHSEKYRDENQNRSEHAWTFAEKLADNSKHKTDIYKALTNDRFIPAGRVQAAFGANHREVSAFNCAASQKIEDNMDSIMEACSKAASILRLGTGIGYNFSHLRPQGDLIVKLQSKSSGPVSFMNIFDAMAGTIASSGHRRGAQMGILNVDHPDVLQFIDAKLTPGKLRHFNISVGVSDAFMSAMKADALWDLKFNGKIYNTVPAKSLWDRIMTNAYNSAEPGVLFLDRINADNNLWYCEDIEITNPCSEQPLPFNGVCLLGSFNLVKYIYNNNYFDYDLFKKDIHTMVRAYDNIFEKSIYANNDHRKEAISKRRMGLGLTGIANAIEHMVGKPSYGSEEFIHVFEHICTTLRDECYLASIQLAKEKGSFPKYSDQYMQSGFISTLPIRIQELIEVYGIRNSHLISFAPCGTISQTVGNVSSGVEPIFYHEVERNVFMKSGKEKMILTDYMVRNHGFYGKTLEECSIEDHMNVLAVAQQYCDSSVSKTINVPSSCYFEDYKKIYERAYDIGAKGITVFRPTELRDAVITQSTAKKDTDKKEFVYGESGSCAGGACSL